MIAYVKLFSDLELETYKNIVYNKYNLYTTSLVRFIAKRRINLISSLRQIYFSLTWTDQITTNLIQFDVKGSTYIHFWNKESLIGINWFFLMQRKILWLWNYLSYFPFDPWKDTSRLITCLFQYFLTSSWNWNIH